MRGRTIISGMEMKKPRSLLNIRAGLPGVLIALVGAGAVHAQSSGKLRMLIDPGDSYEFIVDHEFRMQQREVELTTGPHHFSFWAPQRIIVDTTLTVENGRTKNVVLRLPFSKDYLIYQRDLQHYQRTMKLNRALPMVVTGGAALFTALSYFKVKKAHDQLDEDRDAYANGGSSYRIGVLKDQTIPGHKDDFKKAQTQYVVAGGLTLLCAGVTAFLYHRSGRIARPGFQDKEKLRFDGLSWIPQEGGGQWMAGLTLNFGK